MLAEITSSTYENGKRVEIQRVTYEKSDDLYALATLQRRYENVCKQIENSAEGANIDSLLAEKERLVAEVEAKENVVAGYDAAEK